MVMTMAEQERAEMGLYQLPADVGARAESKSVAH